MLGKSECGPVCRTVRLLKETSTAETFKGIYHKKTTSVHLEAVSETPSVYLHV